MSTLTVRFAGICCFMNPRPNKNDKFAKRVLLPIDKHARDADRNDGQHIPYIEFDILDRAAVTGRFADQFTYARDLVSYRRYHLSGDRISIANAVPRNGGHLNILSTYDERVPSMSNVTQGKLTYPDDKYFSNHPSSNDVAAIFDMQFGDLHAGPVSLLPTRFSDPTAFTPRRLAQWVELQVPIKKGEKPMIEIESFNGNGYGKRTIELAETTDHITIGNQLKEDIEISATAPLDPTLRPSAENFRAHFSMVYDLFSNKVEPLSRPQNGMTIRNGCVGSQIP
jgi:hypothetical protein